MSVHVLPILPERGFSIEAAAQRIAASLAGAGEQDFPNAGIEALRDEGLLAAPLPASEGGRDLLGACSDRLADVLYWVGWASLVLGRLYEGHVNALYLIRTYGSDRQRAQSAADVRAGRIFAVWNTEAPGQPVTIRRNAAGFVLEGRKVLASGVGHVERPLITAIDENGDLLMIVCSLAPGERADLSAWTAQGMQASASGAVELSGLRVSDETIIGGADDFHRQPTFSGGAWRFAAVQAGGMARLAEEARAHLVGLGRADDPHQLARMGEAVMAAQTARLWVERAGMIVEKRDRPAAEVTAFVNLCRLSVERAGLDILERVQRSVGLAAFMRPHPIERLSRDLATYLRQPAPDRALTEAARYFLAEKRRIAELWV